MSPRTTYSRLIQHVTDNKWLTNRGRTWDKHAWRKLTHLGRKWKKQRRADEEYDTLGQNKTKERQAYVPYLPGKLMQIRTDKASPWSLILFLFKKARVRPRWATTVQERSYGHSEGMLCTWLRHRGSVDSAKIEKSQRRKVGSIHPVADFHLQPDPKTGFGILRYLRWSAMMKPSGFLRIKCWFSPPLYPAWQDMSMLKRVALLRQLCTGSGVPAQNGLINYICRHQSTKAKCRHLKKWPAKGLCGRCLSVWPPLPTPLPATHCLYLLSFTVLCYREGWWESWTSEKVREATVYKAGSKIPTWLTVSPV